MEIRKTRLESEKGLALLKQKLEFVSEECKEKGDKITRLMQENTEYMGLFDEKETELSGLHALLEEQKHSQEQQINELTHTVEDLTAQLAEKFREINRL